MTMGWGCTFTHASLGKEKSSALFPCESTFLLCFYTFWAPRGKPGEDWAGLDTQKTSFSWLVFDLIQCTVPLRLRRPQTARQQRYRKCQNNPHHPQSVPKYSHLLQFKRQVIIHWFTIIPTLLITCPHSNADRKRLYKFRFAALGL